LLRLAVLNLAPFIGTILVIPEFFSHRRIYGD
jgi:hypothetical protein